MRTLLEENSHPIKTVWEGVTQVSSNRPIILSTGRWLLPFHRENALLDKETFSACSDMQGVSSSGVLVSDDEGRTWRAEGQVRVIHVKWY